MTHWPIRRLTSALTKDDLGKMNRLREEFGCRSAESITPIELERWLADEAEESEWKPATANRYKALLSLLFRLGVESGKVKGNPARLVKSRRENNFRNRWLTPDEETRLRKVIADDYPEHFPEFEIALNTGMRRSEEYGLKWEDVDLGTRLATVRRAKNAKFIT
jgi:integrase